jgi:plastocyanin
MSTFYWSRSRSQCSAWQTFAGPALLAAAVVLMSLAVRADPAPAPPRAGTHSPEDGHTARVTITNFAFSPAILTVPAATALVWTNEDDAPHTVKGIGDNSPIVSPPLDTGESYSMVLERPGTYQYFCTLHPMMVGTIIVR